MVDKRNNAIMLLLDLSAAFDTLNHDLPVSKLKRMYGVNGVFCSGSNHISREEDLKLQQEMISLPHAL